MTEPVNVAQGRGYSIRESAETVQKVIGFEGRLRYDTSGQDGAPFKILDDSRFRSLFPTFKFTDHEKGIMETADYYRSVLWENTDA